MQKPLPVHLTSAAPLIAPFPPRPGLSPALSSEPAQKIGLRPRGCNAPVHAGLSPGLVAWDRSTPCPSANALRWGSEESSVFIESTSSNVLDSLKRRSERQPIKRDDFVLRQPAGRQTW